MDILSALNPSLFMSAQVSYPVLLWPDAILKARQDVPKTLPIYPVEPPKMPQKPKPIEQRQVALNSAIASLPAVMMAPSPVFRPYGMGLTLLGWGVLGMSVCKKLGQWKTYRRRMPKWHQASQLYQDQKRQFEQDEITAHQMTQISQCLSQTIPPDGKNSRAREGRSEAAFGEVLKDFFPGKIHSKRSLNIPEFRYPYTPDFIYFDPETGLYIDIEIDEPYDWRYRKPRHVQGCRKERRRNQFFLERGWGVIRFSEEQVMCWPDRCCKVISEAIAELFGNEMAARYREIQDLPVQRRWSLDDARQMERADARGQYGQSA